jgi:succinyl-CoA synthetase beta subunit
LTDTPQGAKDLAANMIGHTLITKQTGAGGRPCNRVFVVEQVKPKHEKYFAILYDRASQGPLVIASAIGGVTIEDIAEQHPEQIIKEPINITTGISDAQAQSIAERMNFETATATADAAKSIKALYEMFIKCDATMVEVNPFAETEEGRAACIDAKVNFDDNAEFRQQDIFKLRDKTQEDKNEVMAAEYDLNYIQLDGNIGCLVNGAGLAMATMDICKLYGGEPANFLDVGGSATEQQVTQAFKILQGDSKVKAILVNIFGGIMKCDVIAQGVISAAKETNLQIPLVVRLQGTNVEKANELLAASGLAIIRADSLDDAAQKAVAAL